MNDHFKVLKSALDITKDRGKTYDTTGSGVEENFGLVKIGFDGPDRRMHHQLHSDSCGQVVNRRGLGDQGVQVRASRYFAGNETQLGVVGYCLQVRQAAGRAIVDHDHGFAVPEQTFHQVRADETRATGNQDVFFVHSLSAVATAWASFCRYSGLVMSRASVG